MLWRQSVGQGACVALTCCAHPSPGPRAGLTPLSSRLAPPPELPPAAGSLNSTGPSAAGRARTGQTGRGQCPILRGAPHASPGPDGSSRWEEGRSWGRRGRKSGSSPALSLPSCFLSSWDEAGRGPLQQVGASLKQAAPPEKRTVDRSVPGSFRSLAEFSSIRCWTEVPVSLLVVLAPRRFCAILTRGPYISEPETIPLILLTP